jgi:NhaP-type Na+/H+ or K+/H+ antiporter
MALSIALVSLSGIAAYYLFEKIKLPGLLGMLLAGILLGPYVLDFVHPDLLRSSADFRRIALIIILLRAGFEMSRKSIARIGWKALILSFLPATCEIIGVVLLAPLFLDISMLDAALLGAILGSVSPAIVVPHMIDLQQRHVGTDKDIPALLIASSSVGNVYAIIIFTSLLGMAGGQHVNLAWNFAGIPISIILGIIAGVCLGVCLHWFFKRVHIRDHRHRCSTSGKV